MSSQLIRPRCFTLSTPHQLHFAPAHKHTHTHTNSSKYISQGVKIWTSMPARSCSITAHTHTHTHTHTCSVHIEKYIYLCPWRAHALHAHIVWHFYSHMCIHSCIPQTVCIHTFTATCLKRPARPPQGRLGTFNSCVTWKPSQASVLLHGRR